MTTVTKCLREAGYASDAQVMLYQAPAGKTAIIDRFTVSNNSGGAVTIAVNLVQSGGTAGASNLILPALSVADADVVVLDELAGQVLNTGDFISAIAGAASALVVRISGREVSN